MYALFSIFQLISVFCHLAVQLDGFQRIMEQVYLSLYIVGGKG